MAEKGGTSQEGKKFGLPDVVYPYVRNFVTSKQTEVEKKLWNTVLSSSHSQMAGEPGEAQLISLLFNLSGGKTFVEVGVFRGSTTLQVALNALYPDTKIIGLDVSEEYVSTAREYWKEAGVEDKIEVIIGPATESLEKLQEKYLEKVDCIFVDADKFNYENYFELGLKLLKKGGLFIFDNILWKGTVPQGGDENCTDDVAKYFHTLNPKIMSDERVQTSMLPYVDGIILARKK